MGSCVLFQILKDYVVKIGKKYEPQPSTRRNNHGSVDTLSNDETNQSVGRTFIKVTVWKTDDRTLSSSDLHTKKTQKLANLSADPDQKDRNVPQTDTNRPEKVERYSGKIEKEINVLMKLYIGCTNDVAPSENKGSNSVVIFLTMKLADNIAIKSRIVPYL